MNTLSATFLEAKYLSVANLLPHFPGPCPPRNPLRPPPNPLRPPPNSLRLPPNSLRSPPL